MRDTSAARRRGGVPRGAPASAANWARLVPNGRILLIRPSAVGDVIKVLPSLVALRRSFPQAHIGFIVEDRARDLIEGHPHVDRVHLFPRKRWLAGLRHPSAWRETACEVREFVSGLRRERYDASLDFQGNLKGAVLGLLAGARCRIGYSSVYSREGNYFFTHVHVTPAAEDRHRAENFLALPRFLGADTREAAYVLPDSPRSRERVQGWLAAQGLSAYAVIHPGTSDFGRAKRWPAERFGQVARGLGALGLRTVVAWGPGERPVAGQVVAASGGSALLAPETPSLLDLAELIRGARLFVGCDSGPMHLSSAVGTPCVAIFGPHDPQVYGPFRHPRFRVVHKRLGGVGKTEWVSAEDVLAAAKELIGRTRRR